MSLFLTGCGPQREEVVAYCAQDKVYTIPLFADFERQTGIKVLPLYDSEAVKTVGLVNRLLAEHTNPRCDVFWGNEEMRTRQLAAADILRETNGWAAFGYRTRRIVINTNLVRIEAAPRSLLDLTNETWRGQVALAYPQFGTTSTHFHALRQLWGAGLWLSWARALAANEPLVVDGNSVVVNTVGRGDAMIGLTDSDDIAVGQREGLPVAALPLNKETLFIPNTAAVIRGAPHPEAAQRLFEFLQSPKVTDALVEAQALEGANYQQASQQGMDVRWDELLANSEKVTEQLNQIFLR